MKWTVLVMVCTAQGCTAPEPVAESPQETRTEAYEFFSGLFRTQMPYLGRPVVQPSLALKRVTEERAPYGPDTWRGRIDGVMYPSQLPREYSGSAGSVDLWGHNWAASWTLAFWDVDQVGVQRLDLRSSGQQDITYQRLLDSHHLNKALWQWPERDNWQSEQGPFVDLNADGVLDFAFIIDSYKTPYVEVWLSGPDSRHHAVEAPIPDPVVEDGRVIGVEVSQWGDHWTTTVYNFLESEQPISDRRYWIAPDTTGGDGRALLMVYDQPDSLDQSQRETRLPPPPDAFVPAASLSRAEWGHVEPQDSVESVRLRLAAEVDRLSADLSLVAAHPRSRSSHPLRFHPELLLLRSPRERARLSASVLR